MPSESPRTSLIYFLKKLHKTPISVRPIALHINSPTANISAFIDDLLKPIVKEINHILQNSKQLITEIQSLHFSNQIKLVTLDIVSLYPNIPIEESIQIILTFIEQYNNPTYPPVCIINHLLRFVLNYNCFSFADLFFLQAHGIAMGTKLAPNYANLFMTDFENQHVFTWKQQPLYYCHYIDDIFLLWNYMAISFPAKNISCRNQQCGSCQQLTNRSHYSSHQTKHYFKIPDIYSCDTTHAVYLLECPICNKQYIGETHTAIRNCMKHHRNMSKSALNRPIYAHLELYQIEFSSYKLTIIDKIVDLQERKQKEKSYIKLLKTKIPFGLNVIHPKKK